ncbi:hypothetical protein LTR35_005436 [Friedmanniomyces endolithicus]|uniref:AB hydrolase-1 domain-containing protein n=1 Tax=Friedmanniomyces endolithicus TaxID=329885 RepID=A0AAN6FBC3_9PEZI|nr:hypothetical protein LTR35_005436 [Friedmanniomyces endolithicus]KAK0299361.1 hypothetical protein LTS00_001804 [Friedmanniomyces endolithicus]KAK0310953.1 hypothetical protein LTR82_014556 [Friedmanniomyces endolithicus]KAK0983385.1 hypothetical protein LTR54_014345 [Friedmanniomyces endolithicus]
MYTMIHIPALLEKTSTIPSVLDPPWQQHTATFPKGLSPEEQFPPPTKMATQTTARTLYITTQTGQINAYRRLGPVHGIPLVMHIHYRANMDFWDSLLIDTLAATRPVILFDQPGVGHSLLANPGLDQIPLTFQGWADNVLALIDALELKKVDLFGFSMGGCAMQMVALTRPEVVRKLVLAGTGPSAPSPPSTATGSSESKARGTQGIVWPREVPPADAIAALSAGDGTVASEIEAGITASFFPATNAGRAAAREYFARIYLRSRDTITAPNTSDGDGDREEGPLHTFLTPLPSARQRAAYAHWSHPNPLNSFDRLGELTIPVLVLNGDDDLLIPTSRSWELMKGIEDAELIVYPRAGHGFLWQFAVRVAGDVGRFLDGELGEEGARGRL